MDHLDQEVSLVREEAVDAPFHHAGSLGDVGDQSLVVTLFREHGTGGRENVGHPSLGGKSIDLTPPAGCAQ